jgi:hypothetical protein
MTFGLEHRSEPERSLVPCGTSTPSWWSVTPQEFVPVGEPVDAAEVVGVSSYDQGVRDHVDESDVVATDAEDDEVGFGGHGLHLRAPGPEDRPVRASGPVPDGPGRGP